MICLLWEAVNLHHRNVLTKNDQPNVMSCHVQFLTPGIPGEASISLTDVKIGKAASTVHAVLSRGGKQIVVAYFTYVLISGLEKR